ncbi:hypothetical protein EDB89DRAFT_2050164 [Lactarius sanguifluus]|nr:hypothetical protein EDB89DRAFT_2050164 [Lactarius sanguifluus]
MHNYPFSSPMLSRRSESHVMIAPEDFSPMRLGHAAVNAGPAAASGFSDGQWKLKMRHLCKNMKAVQCTASSLLAFIGMGGTSQAVTAPVPESSITCIQITTTSPASNKFAPLLVVKPFAPIPGGLWSGGNRVTIPPMPYPVQRPHERPSGYPQPGTRPIGLSYSVDYRAGEKLVLMAPARSILATMLLATVGLPRFPASASAEPITRAQEYDEFYHGLDEVNLRSFLQVHRPSLSSSAQRLASQILFALSPFPVPRSVPRYISKTLPSQPLRRPLSTYAPRHQPLPPVLRPANRLAAHP